MSQRVVLEGSVLVAHFVILAARSSCDELVFSNVDPGHGLVADLFAFGVFSVLGDELDSFVGGELCSQKRPAGASEGGAF